MTDPSPTWSYEPGEHLAVLGPRLAVVVPADRGALAARLWAVVDGGGDLVQVADVLAAEGLAALPGAAVVAWEGGGRVTVLARGTDPRVVVRSGEGTAVVDGTAARTWVERSFERVRSVSVLAGDRGPEDDVQGHVLGVPAGLVRVSRVARTLTDPLGDRAPEAEVADPVADPVSGPGADTEPAVPEPDPEPHEEPHQEPHEEPQEEPQEEPEQEHEEREPQPPTASVARGPAEPPQPTLAPADQPTEAHSVLPGATTWPGEGDGAPRLRVSDGREVVVDSVVVVGRSPGARDRHAGADPRLLRLDSPQQEISGTHLEVRPGTGPDAGAAVVTDLGSTNGTVVEHAAGPPEALVPGVGVALGPGAVVHVGDGVTLRLLGPGD